MLVTGANTGHEIQFRKDYLKSVWGAAFVYSVKDQAKFLEILVVKS